MRCHALSRSLDGTYSSPMEIRVLGPVELVGTNGDEIALQGNKMRGLLAALALERGRAVSAERLIDTLWGEQEVSGANVVQVLVSKLRRIVAAFGEADLVLTTPAGYQLVADATTDLAEFESLVDEARRASDPERSASLLERGLALWRGAPLGGAPDTEALAGVRTRLVELRNAAVDDLTDVGLQLGRHHVLAGELEQLVAEEPLRERRWGQLMRALYGSGRQADAMRAFQRARDTLVEEIGAEPGPELRRIEAAVLAHDDSMLLPTASHDPAPIGHGFRRRGNLRHPVSACIGRDVELAVAVELLADHRLVTLLGPGGVGKTRLAQEIGARLADSTPDGVWWVDAIATRTEADVVGAVQRSLGIEGGPVTDPTAALAAVVSVLAERHALVIIDNCEHVVDAVRDVVDGLLARCRDVRVVTTSRERIGLASERIVAVRPLTADAAVELFLARVALDGTVAERSDDVLIRDICARLDCLPLAVELAAARTRYSTLDELAQRLADRFDALPATTAGDGRQRDLRAVAEWSYDLLDESERRVFERLSAFSDGATLAAATRVCAGDDVDPREVEAVLHRLVDKSLVVADRSTSTTRFRMLQTLADFAAERLLARGTSDAVRRAHAEWVADLAATVAFGVPTDGRAVAAVQAEDAAIRDAVQWALGNEPALALRICDALSAFWFGTMRVSAGWDLLERALDASRERADRAERASAQTWAAVFATMVQDLDAAAQHAEEALTFERELGDPMRLGRATLMMALAAGYRNDRDWTRWIDESHRHFSAAGLDSGTGHAAFAEGAVHLLAGDLTAGAERLRTAIDEFRRHGDHLGQILAVSRLGELAWRAGDIEQYATLHADLLELGRSGDSPGVTIGALARLAHARLAAGHIDDAEALARQALDGSGTSFMPVINGYVFRSAGLVNLALGHLADGRQNLADAIDEFSTGAGSLGIGQAALCWIDLSASYMATGGQRRRRTMRAHRCRRSATLGRTVGVRTSGRSSRAPHGCVRRVRSLEPSIMDPGWS